MKQITKQDLRSFEWKQVENEIPVQCNSCNQKVKAGGFYFEIELGDGNFMFVVCSSLCKSNFINHPLVIDYINDRLAQVQ